MAQNTTLLQALTQPTRYRHRVQPQFESFKLDDPDYMKYNLDAYFPHHPDNDAAATHRTELRPTGPDNRGSTAPAAVQSRMAPQPLGLENAAPPSPPRKYSGPRCTESCKMDCDWQPQCKELMTQTAPVLRGAGCSDEAEEWATSLSGHHGAHERYDNDDSAGGAYDHEAYDDGKCPPERPSPQHLKGQPHERVSCAPQETRNSSRRSSTFNTEPEREKRRREEAPLAGKPCRSSASNSQVLSADGGSRRRSALSGGGNSATDDFHEEYGPNAGEGGVESSRLQRFQVPLPVMAQDYGRPHAVSANRGTSGISGNSQEGEVDEGEGFEDGDALYEDGREEWGDVLNEWEDGDDGGAAAVRAHDLYANDGERCMDTRGSAYHSRDGADAENKSSYLKPPPPTSKGHGPQPSPRALFPPEAPVSPSQHLYQRPTRRIQRQAGDVEALQPSRKTSQQPWPVEREVDRPSMRDKKTRSNKHNPRAFRNRTTHTWVSTNTTTTVVLPPATVQLVPMSPFAMAEARHLVDHRWAAAVLPPASPYSVSSQSMPGYQLRHSQMEVLEDNGRSSFSGRKPIGNSLPCLPSSNTV
ncbi:hypothetical protein, conserved [Leishmania tarentolae]|uniref:Uncharacterized protein n=1 Tax=Leishmania tarentolae TaxID=5689 RepID=A0A640KCN4_LEITA|nr:hypothetical protein, conserved [Leishmania tarentolae]